MLYLVTGQPGNGKTLRAMSLMLAEYERNQEAVKQGKEQPRRFFSNVAGSYQGDTITPNPDAFPWVEPIPEDNDWTQLPDGAFIVYDEAHADGKTAGLERYGMLFPATGKPGESNDPRIRAMSTHRHRGVDIVLVTQYPTKVHHQVRSLVGQHIHMTRAMGLAAAGMLTWVRTQADPYDEKQREKAEEEIWHYPKDLYKRYRSATIHTSAHKFRLPKKVKNGLITGAVLLFMLLAASWFFDFGSFLSSGEGRQAQAEPSGARPAPALPWSGLGTTADDLPEDVSPGVMTYASINTAPAPTLSGCAASHRGCLCYNVDGFVIDMSERECRALLDQPLPFNVAHEFRSQRDRRERDKDDAQRLAVIEAAAFGDPSMPVAPQGAFRGEGTGSPEGYELQGW